MSTKALKSSSIPDIDQIGPGQPGREEGRDEQKIKAAAAASAAGVLALTGVLRERRAPASTDTLSVVGYSVLEAANKPVFADFQKTDAGKDVDVPHVVRRLR